MDVLAAAGALPDAVKRRILQQLAAATAPSAPETSTGDPFAPATALPPHGAPKGRIGVGYRVPEAGLGAVGGAPSHAATTTAHAAPHAAPGAAVVRLPELRSGLAVLDGFMTPAEVAVSPQADGPALGRGRPGRFFSLQGQLADAPATRTRAGACTRTLQPCTHCRHAHTLGHVQGARACAEPLLAERQRQAGLGGGLLPWRDTQVCGMLALACGRVPRPVLCACSGRLGKLGWGGVRGAARGRSKAGMQGRWVPVRWP
jgi:hypothetical protein